MSDAPPAAPPQDRKSRNRHSQSDEPGRKKMLSRIFRIPPVQRLTKTHALIKKRAEDVKKSADKVGRKVVDEQLSQDTVAGRLKLLFLVLSGLVILLWLISFLTTSILSNLASFELLARNVGLLKRVRERDTRFAHLEDFTKWASETCSPDKPWIKETLLCQAVFSMDPRFGQPDNWLVRMILMVKVAERDVDCETLSREAHGQGLRRLANDEDSPLNKVELYVTKEERARRDLYGVRPPLWKRVASSAATRLVVGAQAVIGRANKHLDARRLLNRIADGDVPLSTLDDQLKDLGPAREQIVNLLRGVLSAWGLTIARHDAKAKLKAQKRSGGCVESLGMEEDPTQL